MATDYWPQEEGYIVEGSPVMMCQTAGTISEMACVEINTGAAGYVLVDHGSAAVNGGDAIGVCLRACTVTGQMVPVAFGGIVKLLANSTIAVQQHVISNGTDDAKVIRPAVAESIGSNDLYFNGGSAWLLGMALQAGITHGDEILVLLAPQ